jgi:hypothetical protein
MGQLWGRHRVVNRSVTGKSERAITASINGDNRIASSFDDFIQTLKRQVVKLKYP